MGTAGILSIRAIGVSIASLAIANVINENLRKQKKRLDVMEKDLIRRSENLGNFLNVLNENTKKTNYLESLLLGTKTGKDYLVLEDSDPDMEAIIKSELHDDIPDISFPIGLGVLRVFGLYAMKNKERIDHIESHIFTPVTGNAAKADGNRKRASNGKFLSAKKRK